MTILINRTFHMHAFTISRDYFTTCVAFLDLAPDIYKLEKGRTVNFIKLMEIWHLRVLKKI